MSPDKIQLSTLKGEGELANLELDEQVLMDVIELPTWLRITVASCNRVAIKVMFRKVKDIKGSQDIHLSPGVIYKKNKKTEPISHSVKEICKFF